MAHFETDIQTRLTGFADLTALVPPSRIFHGLADGTTPARPYVSWMTSYTEVVQTFGSANDHASRVRVRCDAYTTSANTLGQAQARDICEQIRYALNGQTFGAKVLVAHFIGSETVPTDVEFEYRRQCVFEAWVTEQINS